MDTFGMDLDWCLVCGQHINTAGALYCSPACLAHDMGAAATTAAADHSSRSHAQATAAYSSPASSAFLHPRPSSPIGISPDRRGSFQSDTYDDSSSNSSGSIPSNPRFGDAHHRRHSTVALARGGATANILPLRNRGFVNRSPSPHDAASDWSWGL
ncbi:hypothetical protein BDZ88DRAFT_427705 [Geranomyces variabilis]|nr:hypothetical protein BDZ88DRAFT_427705 [Geranomyces variabilis]